MPTRKVLLIVLAVYILVVFIPIIGFLYFGENIKLKSREETSTEKTQETSESTSTAFEQLVKPQTTPSANKLFDPSNWRSGQFGNIEKTTVTISLPNDEKGTLIEKSFAFTSDTLLLCSANKHKGTNGIEIDASKVFPNLNRMTDSPYAEFIKIYKDIPLDERLLELSKYKAGNPIHYGITSDESNDLLWVRIFKEDCGN